MPGQQSAANMRSVSTLIGSNPPEVMPRLKSPRVEEMLTGLYKSSNPNLHDFRRPPGKITDDQSMIKSIASRR